MVQIIDIVTNLHTPVEVQGGQTGVDDDFLTKIRANDELRYGVTVEDYLKKMDRAGIERSLLIALRCGDRRVKTSTEVPYESVHKWCQKYPDRFSGLAGIDPFRGMEQLRDLEWAVKELGFVGAHVYPHWFRTAPDQPIYYPVYAKCCELDVPIMMQVGQNLIYQKDVRLPSVAKPILLDQIAIDFPELKLLGIHVGTPWAREMIAMAWKHENVYIGLDAYAPRHLEPEIVHYMNTYGADKVMWGSDWPVIDPERGVKEMKEHNLRPDSYRKVMRDNALKVFKLPDTSAKG